MDLPVLLEWMEDQGFPKGDIKDVTRLSGGTQNVLMSFTKAGRRFILRRPPSNPRPSNDEVMRREMQVLSAISNTNVPHPKLIAGCEDPDLLGVAFYLMEPVDGFNAVNTMPELHANDPSVRRRMGFALIEGAAALGRVEYKAVGLADFGKPENYLGRQVGRWTAQLESYEALSGWPGAAELPNLPAISEYLKTECPKTFRPGIVHGDYSIGNVMFRFDSPELAAIVDWELSTIGDPLIDLAWIVATWPDSGGPSLPVLVVEPWDGFPSADELIERYGELSDRDVAKIGWYTVLACFKLGIILEGTYARACAGKAPKETGAQLHLTAIRLFERAQTWLP